MVAILRTNVAHILWLRVEQTHFPASVSARRSNGRVYWQAVTRDGASRPKSRVCCQSYGDPRQLQTETPRSFTSL
jgi:hypothetical protein